MAPGVSPCQHNLGGETAMDRPVTRAGAVGDMPMLIGGELTPSESGRWMESINPATEEILGRVPLGSAKDVARAVEAAEAAQPEWAALPVSKRAEYLLKVADALQARGEEILRVEVM